MKSESRSGDIFHPQFGSTQWYCTSET